MNSDLAELLREGIDRATAAERLAPGLPARARRRLERRRLERRRLAIRAAAATASAAAVTATVLLALTAAGGTRRSPEAGTSTPPTGWTGLGVRLDAATVLNRAAKAALKEPSAQDGQFVYTDVRAVNPTHGQAWSYRQQTWESADGHQPGAVRDTMCFPGLPARDNRPTCLVKIPAGRGGPLNVTYAWARSLPTSPASLLQYLEHNNNCSGPASLGSRTTPYTDAFSEVFTILHSLYVLPPRPGAALFQAAAMIPGVTVIRQVTDAAGGRGIAVAMTGLLGPGPPPFRFELIFDPRTYRFIGLQYIALRSSPAGPAGQVIHAETVVSSRVANAAPTDYSTINSAPMTEGGVPACISRP